MRMRTSAERQWRGLIKSDGRKSKTLVKLQSFRSHFVGALNSALSYKKMFSMTKIGRFLSGIFQQ